MGKIFLVIEYNKLVKVNEKRVKRMKGKLVGPREGKCWTLSWSLSLKLEMNWRRKGGKEGRKER